MTPNPPVTYRPETWKAVTSRLGKLSDADLFELGQRLGTQAHTRSATTKNLLNRGGFLLVELGLTTRPELVEGTVFMQDIFEYIIYRNAAEQLAQGHSPILVHYLGGDPARKFDYEELLEALRRSPEFDQLKTRR